MNINISGSNICEPYQYLSKILPIFVKNITNINISGSNICEPHQLVFPHPGAAALQSNFQVQG